MKALTQEQENALIEAIEVATGKKDWITVYSGGFINEIFWDTTIECEVNLTNPYNVSFILEKLDKETMNVSNHEYKINTLAYVTTLQKHKQLFEDATT